MLLEVRNYRKGAMCERARCHGGETNCFLQNFWTIKPNNLPRPLQILTVKLAIDILTRVSNSFALDVKKDQHGLDNAAKLTRSFSARNLANSTATNAAYYQVNTHTAIFHHLLC